MRNALEVPVGVFANHTILYLDDNGKVYVDGDGLFPKAIGRWDTRGLYNDDGKRVIAVDEKGYLYDPNTGGVFYRGRELGRIDESGRLYNADGKEVARFSGGGNPFAPKKDEANEPSEQRPAQRREQSSTQQNAQRKPSSSVSSLVGQGGFGCLLALCGILLAPVLLIALVAVLGLSVGNVFSTVFYDWVAGRYLLLPFIAGLSVSMLLSAAMFFAKTEITFKKMFLVAELSSVVVCFLVLSVFSGGGVGRVLLCLVYTAIYAVVYALSSFVLARLLAEGKNPKGRNVSAVVVVVGLILFGIVAQQSFAINIVRDGICYEMAQDEISEGAYAVVAGAEEGAQEKIAIRSDIEVEGKQYPVRKIRDEALKESAIVSVSLSSNLETVGERAFQSCPLLKSVSVATEGNLYVNEDAFLSCEALKKVSLSAKNKLTLWNRCFSGCKKIENVKLEAKKIDLRRDSFDGCSSLKKVVFGKEAESISGVYVFYRGNHSNAKKSYPTIVVQSAELDKSSIEELAEVYGSGCLQFEGDARALKSKVAAAAK